MFLTFPKSSLRAGGGGGWRGNCWLFTTCFCFCSKAWPLPFFLINKGGLYWPIHLQRELKALSNNSPIVYNVGLPQRLSGIVCLQCRSWGFDSWDGNVPYRREWQPTLVFLPGESQGQRDLAGYSTKVSKSWTWLKLLSIGQCIIWVSHPPFCLRRTWKQYSHKTYSLRK